VLGVCGREKQIAHHSVGGFMVTYWPSKRQNLQIIPIGFSKSVGFASSN
jgi:hypothetical protein